MKNFILAAGAFLLLSSAADAQVVLQIKDGNGAAQSILAHNGGGTSLWLNQSVCDPLTAGLCATVDGAGLHVFLANSPAVTVAGVATANNQTATIGPVAPGAAANNSQLIGCQYNSASPSPTPAQQMAVQCDHFGNANVDVANVTGIVEGSNTAGQTGALTMGTVITTPSSFSTGTSHIFAMNGNGDLRADQMVVGGNASNVQTVVQAHICQNHVTINTTTATDTQLVAPITGKVVYVCDYNFSANAANNINLDSVTGAGCSGAAAMDTLWYLTANSLKASTEAYYRGLATISSSGICLKTSAAAALSFTLYYDQY